MSSTSFIPPIALDSASGKKNIFIEQELQQSFLDYAMSVIVSRAIPDIRDGLKPVHRRVLYTMHKHGFTFNKPYHKSVRVVGDVLGRYHPHGDAAVYHTMVGMVQDFSKRYPLLDGQGNWGSIDGDVAAAMRYTEVRMQRISQEILGDLDKDTVQFVPNFDESTTEPTVLPSRIPHLLINGTMGIAVGMATAVPPHNLQEVVDACIALLRNPDLTMADVMANYIKGPDFPTAGTICGRAGLIKAYTTGRGSIVVRGRATIEETKKSHAIIIDELPYQVIKADLIIKIADLVKNKIIDGITNIRDESDRRGMRIVIEVRRGESPEVILNHLYKFTPLQTTIGIHLLGLLDTTPRVFTLLELLQEFIAFRQEVVYKRCVYDQKQAQERAHILEAFVIALMHIDEVVAIIKANQTTDDAMQALSARFNFTVVQAKALLDMRLGRLTGLEQDKIRIELASLEDEIARLQQLLDDPHALNQEIITELESMRNTYGDARRTRIEQAVDILSEADLVPDDAVVVTLTRKGYIKRVPLVEYQVQHRGGRGKMGMADLADSDDVLQDVFIARNHDSLLFFTNLGRVYNLQVFQVPEASRMAKGRASVNLLPLVEGEKIVRLLPARDLAENYVVMVTRKGTIKRTDAQDFESIRSTGIRAITLSPDDELAFCALSSGSDTIVLATAQGQGIRFQEQEVRAMGRQASGVIGIRLLADDTVVGMEVVAINQEYDLLFATQRGYGKRVAIADFRIAHRAGQGVRTIPTDRRNGLVIGLVRVSDDSDLLLIDEAGKIIRVSSKEVRTMGRQAKGVRLIRLNDTQQLAAIAAYENPEEDKAADSSSVVSNDASSAAIAQQDQE